MHLYKRGNVWWVEYQADGVQHRQSCHTKNKKVAAQWMENIETARRMPTFEEAVEVLRILYGKQDADNCRRIPLDGAWERYETLARSVGRLNISAKAIKDRRNHLSAFVRWLGANAAKVKAVGDVTGVIAAEYAASLEREGKKIATRQNTIGDLSNIWRILAKVEPGLADVWADLSPRGNDSVRREMFTPEQEAAVLAAAKEVGKDWFGVSMVSRCIGCRYGDAANLEWSEIDFAAHTISYTPHKTVRHGISVTVPMVAELEDALKAQPRVGEFVFPLHAKYYGRTGKDVQKLLNFREVLLAAGITDANYTFHSWRHTVRSRLAAAGASTETAMLILGHTDERTSRHYDHDQHLEEKRAALEAATA